MYTHAFHPTTHTFDPALHAHIIRPHMHTHIYPHPQVVSPPEVAFQRDCSAGDVKSLIKSCLDSPDKRLDAMHGRVKKHLGTGRLAGYVWSRLQEELIRRWVGQACMCGQAGWMDGWMDGSSERDMHHVTLLASCAMTLLDTV
jgi:hypothetical protein